MTSVQSPLERGPLVVTETGQCRRFPISGGGRPALPRYYPVHRHTRLLLPPEPSHDPTTTTTLLCTQCARSLPALPAFYADVWQFC